MDIYDYKKRLEKVEKKIRNSSISDKNKKIIFNFEKQMFIKELSMPRIERCISIIGIISEKLGKDLDCLEKEDIEEFLEWIQRKDIKDWTKHTYKQVFKTYLKKTGRTDLANLVVMKRVRNKIPEIFTRQEILKMIDSAIHPMDKDTMRIKRTARKAGIQKRVYNHLFRHTSATEKSEILTSAQMCEYFGWTQGSTMSQIYVHLSGRNLDDTLLKAYGISKDDSHKEKDLAPIKCPRCGTVNGATGKFCNKCGAALDIVTAINVDKERASLTMELMDLIRQEPALLEVLKGHMEARNETVKK